MLNKTPEEILKLYRERSDSLDASSYEVADLCEAVIMMRGALSFYATSENYPYEYDTVTITSAVEKDGGDLARRTLLSF